MVNMKVVIILIIISVITSLGCSSKTRDPVETSIPEQLTEQVGSGQQIGQTYLLGYYDVYIDTEEQTLEVINDRTAAYTINIIPFLNKIASPASGISFGLINFDDTDPANLLVDVDFRWHHPFPTVEQYKVYDFMGVIISNGDSNLNYNYLRVGNYGTDTYMTNADGYTRWFNPSEFTTELIFGWAPGGIQNLKGTAKLNPFKAYGYGLSANDSLWDWLEGGSNDDGVFQSGDGRTMSLEFPAPSVGDGLVFGYAAVCSWEEQGSGPYTPYHRKEPIAFRVTVEDNIYYDGTNSGGNLIADIDVWAWGDQPDTVLVESKVFSGLKTATPTGGGGANWATYEIDVPADLPLTSNDGYEMWVIAECDAYNYINIPGVPAPPGSQPLAAFYRVPLFIGTQPCPIIDSGVNGNVTPSKVDVETYSVVAHDIDPLETLIYTWTVTDNSSGLPAPGYDGVPGDGAGNLDVNWGALGVSIGDTFNIDCDVDDGPCTVSATTLLITIVNADPICDLVVVTVMPHLGTGRVEFDASGTTDPDVGDVLAFSWDFDGDDVFDDVYESGTDENPVYNYDSDYTGTVSVRVTDGNGGEATCESDPLDVTALREVDPIGTPNIDVIGNRGTPQDIACRPTTGETAISFGIDATHSRFWVWNVDYSYATGPCSPYKWFRNVQV